MRVLRTCIPVYTKAQFRSIIVILARTACHARPRPQGGSMQNGFIGGVALYGTKGLIRCSMIDRVVSKERGQRTRVV